MYVARTTPADLQTAQMVARQIRNVKTTWHTVPQESGSHTIRRRVTTASPAFKRLSSEHKILDCAHCRLMAKCKIPNYVPSKIDYVLVRMWRCIHALFLCMPKLGACQFRLTQKYPHQNLLLWQREISLVNQFNLGSTAAQKSINLHFTECRLFLFDQCLIITEDSTVSNNASNSPDACARGTNFHSNFGRVFHGSASLVNQTDKKPFGLTTVRPQRLQPEGGVHLSPYPGGRSPGLRRPVNLRRHVSSIDPDVSPIWTKLVWSATADPFRQSPYRFIHSVRVNRLAFAVSIFH